MLIGRLSSTSDQRMGHRYPQRHCSRLGDRDRGAQVSWSIRCHRVHPQHLWCCRGLLAGIVRCFLSSSRNLHVGLPRSGVRKKRAISWVDFVVRLVQTWVRPRLSFRTSATSPSSRGRLPRTTLISTCFSVSVPASSTPDVACNWWSGFKSCRSGLESPASQSTSHRFTPSPVSLPPSVNGYRVSMTSSIWYSSSLLRCRV